MELSRVTHTVALGGSDFLVYPLGDLTPDGRGQVVEFSLRLRGICPERRVAVAVTVSELDGEGTEFPRGMKTFTVPPHHGAQPQDIALEALRFALPGDLDVSADGHRQYTVRADCHYIDQNGRCALAAD